MAVFGPDGIVNSRSKVMKVNLEELFFQGDKKKKKASGDGRDPGEFRKRVSLVRWSCVTVYETKYNMRRTPYSARAMELFYFLPVVKARN